ncbi:MAG TPA: MFS transporter [Actinomycetes bacterium]
MLVVASPPRVSHGVQGRFRSGFALAAVVLGFFVVTLDAVVVNVALPSIRGDLGGAVASSSGPVLGGLVALAAFLAAQARGAHPMVPLELFRSRTVSVAVAVGFAFVVGYYGLPFVMSLYLQQLRGLSSLATGVAFLPMMVVGALVTPFSARLAERLGARQLIGGGLALMTAGLAALAVVRPATPVWVLAGLMVLVGLAGPLVSPPVTAVLLNSVPGHRAGVASGVFNTSRQVGGALAVAVFGALLAQPAAFTQGLRTSLLLAAGVGLAAAAASRLLQPSRGSHDLEAAPA